MPKPLANPFQITAPVAPEEVIDREDVVRKLRALGDEGNHARLVAPRRFGKTSILGKVQSELRQQGWTTVYVDLSGILTTSDLAERIRAAYVAALKGPVARWFVARRRSLKPKTTIGGGSVPAGVELDLSDVPPELLELLDLPKEVAAKTDARVHVVFDEFQELLMVRNNLDSVVRSRIQHHGRLASYVFAGSQISMLEELFTNRKRAFYGQAARVELDRLDDEPLAQYVVERFERTEREIEPQALSSLLSSVSGHPQRAMLSAHELWDESGEGVADIEAWERARSSIMANVEEECGAQWRALDGAERRALAAIAVGRAPYGKDVPAAQRGKTVQNAIVSLVDKGLIAGAGRDRRVVDPLMSEWVSTRHHVA